MLPIVDLLIQSLLIRLFIWSLFIYSHRYILTPRSRTVIITKPEWCFFFFFCIYRIKPYDRKKRCCELCHSGLTSSSQPCNILFPQTLSAVFTSFVAHVSPSIIVSASFHCWILNCLTKCFWNYDFLDSNHTPPVIQCFVLARSIRAPFVKTEKVCVLMEIADNWWVYSFHRLCSQL